MSQSSSRDRLAGWLFTAPAATVLLLMVVFPFAYTAYLSFFEWFAAGPPPRFNGLGNYIALLSDERFLNSLARTLVFTALSVTVEVFLGVALALMFAEPFVGRGAARTVFMLPMVATPVALSFHVSKSVTERLLKIP